ncbi:MAG: hypothetical protein H5U36_10000, partial [Candidatus Caldatribacterium sp.]|nr:hypothetical protein [Candidatus Caldatribacterium sp.]
MGKENPFPRDFWLILSFALLLRILFAFAVYGFPPDIACFRGWAEEAASRGL